MKIERRNGFVVGLTAACSLIFAPAVFAGGDHGKKGVMGAVEAEVKMMDTDGNGKLTPEEHTAGARQMFVTMDENKDGKVTAAEMEAATDKIMGEKGKPMHGKHAMSAAEKIKVCDTDGDGALTAAEHEAGAKTMFGKMDADKDGLLTKNELAAGHKKMLRKSH